METMLNRQTAGCGQLTSHQHFAQGPLAQPCRRHQSKAVRSRVVAAAERYTRYGCRINSADRSVLPVIFQTTCRQLAL